MKNTIKKEKRCLAILSLNLGGKKKKLLDPIRIADCCEYLANLYGSNKKVAEKIGRTAKLIGQFRSLLKLPDSVKLLIKYNKIGIDAGSRIASLRNVQDQKEIAELVVKHNLHSQEIRYAVFIKNRNPKMTINECVRLLLKSRPIVKRRHLIITGIKSATLQRLHQESEQYGVSPHDLIKEIVGRLLPSQNNIVSLEMHNEIVSITLQEEGFRALENIFKKSKTTIDDFVEDTITDWLNKKDVKEL